MRAFLRRLVSALRRQRLDEELREEMAAHIDARRDDLIADGMDAREAAAEARRQFGNVTVIAERTREARGLPGLESFVRDMHYGVRLLVRAPLFASIAVLSIAFGLAGALTMFTVVNAMVLRPVTAGASDVFRVFTSGRDGSRLGSSSFADYRDFAGARAFEQTCAMDSVRATMTAVAAAGSVMSTPTALVSARRNDSFPSPRTSSRIERVMVFSSSPSAKFNLPLAGW